MQRNFTYYLSRSKKTSVKRQAKILKTKGYKYRIKKEKIMKKNMYILYRKN